MTRYAYSAAAAAIAALLSSFSTPVFSQVTCTQILPNPNPAGNSIVFFDSRCNSLNPFENYGRVTGDATITNYGTVNTYAGARFDARDMLHNAESGTWNNWGGSFSNDVWNHGLLNNYGSIASDIGFWNTGTINNFSGHLEAFRVFNNNGTINNYAGAVLSTVTTSIENSGVISNAGRMDGEVEISNSGQLSVLAGGETRSTHYTQRAGSTVVNGTMMHDDMTIQAGGLSGSGSINLVGEPGDRSPILRMDGGTIAPGNSVGTLTVNGDLSFNDGILSTEVGLGGSDLLAISGAATFLAGTFEFSFLGGVLPTRGTEWLFLTAGSISGWENLAVSVLGAPNRLAFDVTSHDGGLYLAVAPIPEPEVYAMMLVGLSFVGFTARRRSRRLSPTYDSGIPDRR